MEYVSESSCDDRPRDLETSEGDQQVNKYSHNYKSSSWQPELRLNTVNKTLSAQVMEYYHKYSQSSNLDRYFSLPTPSTTPEALKYYCSIYEVNPMLGSNRQECIGEEYNLRSYVPRERRRWTRPALIGQSSATEASSQYMQPLVDPRSVSPDLKRSTPDTIPEEKSESRETLQDPCERKTSSPTSSVASHKPLEWDSGADVGYYNSLSDNKQSNKKLSTIERMALARGCSAALRLDPEGTTESEVSGKITIVQTRFKSSAIPDANSTALTETASGSEEELEITPIVKNHLSGIINGSEINSDEKYNSKNKEAITQSSNKDEQINSTPKSSFVFKVPFVKYPTECKKSKNKRNELKEQSENLLTLPLKKSTSMNTLTMQSTKLTLKRSQSDLNLFLNDKNRALLPLIFNSTSSIATVVNKPTTSDKVVQTTINECSQESVGVQVSVFEEEKPPLPKRGASLQKSLHSILKNPKGTYKVEDAKNRSENKGSRKLSSDDRLKIDKPRHNSTEISHNDSAPPTPRADDTENLTGRANSFEYFPGHIYENVPNGSGSRISSVDTAESNSTIPNTSSSIDEKLWGDSDSLVRDLERSVNILRSLVDANKCDKQVKKRLIHHVVKRLVTAKYTDDKIEHNLEDNVPWNPDDARKKVYRAEILQALAKKHSTTDSSDDWKPQKKNGCAKKTVEDKREPKEATLGSSNSDKFNGNTDRTENDGRKARMGLRTDDRRHNSATDPDKSESSDCFFPPRTRKSSKTKNIFCLKDKLPRDQSTTTNSTPPDHNRILLDAVVNNRRMVAESSNNTENNIDWRLPTTLSERQFEMKKCNSDSGDTKLVSYAQMEKRNQLDWITNEIIHLCNLKKLLESPQKLERPKSSPRKSKSPGFKQKPFTVLTCLHDQSGDANYLQRNMRNTRDNFVNEQWSSHCNLATCEPIQQLGKRNSCAQTATENAYAHSRTGGEIVSIANTYGSSVQLVSTGTQTQETLSTESDVERCVACSVHKPSKSSTPQSKKHSFESAQCACTRCAESQNQLKDERRKAAASVDHFCADKPTSRLPSSNSEGSLCGSESNCRWVNRQNGIDHNKQKDTKNQINATKSKFACDSATVCQCISDCVCKKNRVEEKSAEYVRESLASCQMCPKESQESNKMECEHRAWRCELAQRGSACKHENYYTCNGQSGNAVRKCACGNVRAGTCERSEEKIVSSRHEQCQPTSSGEEAACKCSKENFATLCKCPSNCTCENRWLTGIRAHNSCECRSGMKYRARVDDRQAESRSHPVTDKVQTTAKCNCGKDCLCANKLKQTNDEQCYGTKYTGQSNRTSESASNDSAKSCRCCRTCGLAYQSTKKCNCHEVYPKPVAYEISFAKEDEHKDAVNPLPRLSEQNNGKLSDCACDKTNFEDLNRNSRRNTLQDFLSRNRPGFVNNAETRRQFMSEISQLRELRKEKRLQLLAMASSTQVIPKSPRSSVKPIACAQKKISDEEMKQRLRKRYRRLNEVQLKRKQQEKQEEARRNKLMAKIFCKKLQQKVLRGQVDLSQSVSVISNI